MTEQTKDPRSTAFQELEQQVRDWVSNDDTRKKLSEAYKTAATANREAEVARQVDPEDLSEPFTL